MTHAEIIKGLKAVRTIHNGNYAPCLDAAIKELKAREWIPVSERYPEDGQRVLVDYCDEDIGIKLMRFNVNGYRGFKAWMPLPKPYEPQESEG